VSPRQGNIRLRRWAATAAAVAAMAAVAPAAIADEVAMPTTQAVAYNADWVPYLDPPEKPAAVCLVDSGVNITPDTPADSPEGPIVKRLALDGGPGTAANATWEGLHGTRMAFVGAAPVNGWGAVGFWPGARIVSIRAMPIGQAAFPFNNYQRAIELCTKDAAALDIVAVNLSLDCGCVPTPEEQSDLDTRVAQAHANDISVVAAAGNNGGVVGSPANEPGVVAVAAGNETKTLCSFSNRGVGIDLVAPGCNVDLADPTSGQPWSRYPSGTSGASITTSVALALVRSYRPDLTREAAEEVVTNSARGTAGEPVLDLERVFRAAGIGALVEAAKARTPTPVTSNASPALSLADSREVNQQEGGNYLVATELKAGALGPTRLTPPRVKSLVKHGLRLVVEVRDLPPAARLVASLQARRSEFGFRTVARVSASAPFLKLRLPRRWRGGRLLIRYERTEERHAVSRFVVRTVPR
jgi:Subtilase family